MVVVDYTRRFTKVMSVPEISIPSAVVYYLCAWYTYFWNGRQKWSKGAKPNFWSSAEPNIRSVAGAKSFSILLGSPSTYINYKFVCFHYLDILDNIYIYIYIYIVYMVSVDVRLFILHLDFWKSRSWKIKVCFKP